MAESSQKEYIITSSEGHINSKFETENSKLSFRLRRQGYTLVEMAVVMGIIGVLMLLSVSAFFSLREQSMVDQVTEELLSVIREAQNRATSISPDREGNDTKVWAVSVANNNFSLISLYDGGVTTERANISPQQTTISVSGSGSTPIDSGHIAYASPFAEAYLLSNTLCSDGVLCNWSKSLKPTEEWELNPITVDNLLTGEEFLQFTVAMGNHNSKIIVRPNGDTEIE